VRLRQLARLRYTIVSHVQMRPPPGTAFRDTAHRWYAQFRDDVALTLVTNQTLADYLVSGCGYSESRVRIAANPVDFGSFDVPRAPREPPVVAMVAQWRPQKDFETAVKAAHIVSERGLDANWWFIGAEEDGALVGRTRRLVDSAGLGDAVSILGRRTDVPALLGEASVGLLTTHFEGSPVAVAEYAAARLPVVVSNVEGTTHLVHPDDGIFGVPPGSPVAVADEVCRLLSLDADRREELGRRARARLEPVADVAAVIEAATVAYRTALGASRAV
jgi:glycosyltransferase involved in cell wall biosynthesis